jgi:hypothetical protein
MSKVYFLRIKKQSPEVLKKAGKKISEVFSDFFGSGDKVAIKLHFGERGSKTYLNPILVKAIWEELTERVKKAVLMDCTVLYRGERSFCSSYKNLAQDHGFGFAPIIIADGEKGEEVIKIKINQKHFKEIKVGKGLKDFNALLAISHLTGHGSTGFGGALKNIGMGLGSKGGKLEMHQAFKLKVNQELCQGCGTCQRECPARAIIIKNGKAQIDYQKCIGCGQCISVCPYGAVETPWEEGSSRDLQERIVEYVYGILKGRKSFFINVLLNITSGCDCVRGIQEPMVEDIGIFGSGDIVAIEQASLDLVGEEKFKKFGVNPSWQINYTQKLGLGQKEYELIKI